MTEPEIQALARHIFETRIGICCGDKPPSETVKALARADAQAYADYYRANET